MATKQTKKSTKKKPKVKIENARSMKIATLIIIVIAILYMISPQKQKDEINEVLPTPNTSLNTSKKITLTDDIKKEYETWVTENNLALSAITTVTSKEVTDSNKLRFLIINLKNKQPEKTSQMSEESAYTCVKKETATALLPTLFANAFSDTAIPMYDEKKEETGVVKTLDSYCDVVKDDYGMTLPSTLKTMTLNEKTNVYTLTFTSSKITGVFTISLKNMNGNKLIQEMSFI